MRGPISPWSWNFEEPGSGPAWNAAEGAGRPGGRVMAAKVRDCADSIDETRLFYRGRWMVLSVAALALASAPVAAELPVAAENWITSGAAGREVIDEAMTISQQTEKAILNWQSFNIGEQNRVVFNQPGATSMTLNRIGDTSASRIMGALEANGHIYLINPNGMLFGPGARVDVNHLVASSLDISDAVFEDIGIAGAIENADGLAAFEADGERGAIRIAEGARLTTASGGRILILAPEVVNSGRIETPDGQTMLVGAKDKVYLYARDDSEFRNLLVEVETGGDVTNLGEILARRGNATLLGLAVNQMGRVTATSAVNANGSIRLVARDGAEVDSTERVAVAQRGGAVVLGEDSRTEVLADDDGGRATDDQAVPASVVEVTGHSVHIRRRAEIRAPAGEVRITASGRPDSLDEMPEVRAGGDSTARVYLDPQSVIDVSGLEVEQEMSRNVIEVELRANELADSPEQRNGPLRGETIMVDVRTGTPLADTSGAEANITRGIDERSTHGGVVSIRSEGDLVMSEGARVDVSGGGVRYRAGTIKTSKLVGVDGSLVDVADADPDRRYDSVLAARSTPGEEHAGYVDGKDAGRLEILAPKAQLHGEIAGGVRSGPYQREAPPRPGTLVINDPDLGTNIPATSGFGAAVVVGGIPVSATIGFEDAFPEETLMAVKEAWLEDSGFGHFRIHSGERIDLPSAVSLQLTPGGSLGLFARDALRVDGAVTTPGGDIVLGTTNTTTGGDITIGPDAVLDTTGRWINDARGVSPATPVDPLFIDGGRIAVGWTFGGDGNPTAASTRHLTLAEGSVLVAGGGAHLARDGSLTAGRGGEIRLSVSENDSVMTLDGDFSAFALAEGGSLNIRAVGIGVGAHADPQDPTRVVVTPELFAERGFGEIELTATDDDDGGAPGGGLIVAEQVAIRPRQINLALKDDAILRASGAEMDTLTRRTVLAAHQRRPVDVTLAAEGAGESVRISADASLVADPGARLTLSSEHSVFVDGLLQSKGGLIELVMAEAPKNGGGRRADFDPTQALWLGGGAVLDVSGTVVAVPDDRGLRRGEVLAGGEVRLHADRGSVVTQAGSLIDVSGARATLDLANAAGNGFAPTTVASAGGTVSVRATNAGVLDGAMQAKGGGPGAAGGELTVDVSAPDALPGSQGFPSQGHRIVLRQQIGPRLPDGLTFGDALPVALDKTTELGAQAVMAAGFDSLTLLAQNKGADGSPAEVRFAGDMTLTLGRQFVAGTQVIASDAAATVRAPYISVGGLVGDRGNVAPTAGEGSLRLQADLLDIVGDLAVRDVNDLTLASRGDIRLQGVAAAGGIWTGELRAGGDVTLAAGQVYPVTETDYRIYIDPALAPEGRVTFTKTGAEPPPAPLSAGGRLAVDAPYIDQGGRLRAPLGEIVLKAGKSLTLAGGSLTSTSLEGAIVPYGRTELIGEDWVYPKSLSGISEVATPPQKRVTLAGPDLRVAEGSVVDESGGGDLQAYEFIPGPGGSADFLAPGNGRYAILPAHAADYAPYDPTLWKASGLRQGDSIHLGPGAGLPAGEYVLLPARYALLPQAYVVEALDGTADFRAVDAYRRADGAAVTEGRRTVSGTDFRQGRSQAYAVYSRAEIQQESEYLLTGANEFFGAADGGAPAPLPRDAGQWIVDARENLLLEGFFRAEIGPGGRSGRVDVAADELTVVSARSDNPDGIELTVDDLNQLGAASLLLGGVREASAESTEVDVGARRVTVAQGAALTGPEILLAGTETVTVAAGARVSAEGALTSPDSILDLSGDGVLLRASAGEQVSLRRRDSSGAGGDLIIAEDALVRADSALLLDATGTPQVEGELRVDGGSLNLGAERIGLGDGGVDAGGLVLSNAQLQSLVLEELVLTSRSQVDLYSDVSLDLSALRIEAGALAGHLSAGQAAAVRVADRIHLANPAGVAGGPAMPGQGELTLQAETLVAGEGDFALRGFETVTLDAKGRVSGVAEGGLFADGAMHVVAREIGAAPGARTSLVAGEALTTAHAEAGEGETPASLVPPGLGGQLTLQGRRVEHGGNIQLPAGRVSLQAVGDGADDGVTLLSGSEISVAGRSESFADVVAHAPGGTVELAAANADVRLQGGARIDVSGAADGGDGGRLEIFAPNGQAVLEGELAGQAAAGWRGASAALDVASGASFDGINGLLNDAGFTLERRWRVRNGDVQLNQTLNAWLSEVSVDQGTFTVAGEVNAEGADGGQIRLHAGGDLNLTGEARLLAGAQGEDGDGGRVELGSRDGRLDLAAGAEIDVSGGPAGDGGRLDLRARRTGEGVGDGVAVGALAAQVAGADQVVLEAFRTYGFEGDGAIDAAAMDAWRSDTEAYMAGADTIIAGLGPLSTQPAFRLRPGLEVRAGGDLTLTQQWDLQPWRFGGEPGVLTLAAGGDLRFQADLTDGFAAVEVFPGFSEDTLMIGPSWGYRLVAGADAAGAAPTATAVGDGSVVVGAERKVRTGTGDIAVAAAGDIRLQNAGSVIYTAGEEGGNGGLPDDPFFAGFAFPGSYPVGGGDLWLRAGGDIVGVTGDNLITDWQHRMGTWNPADPPVAGELPVAWNVYFPDFRHGVGALGGGDVRIEAGGDIVDLGVSLPTVGRQEAPAQGQGLFDLLATGNTVTVLGGGDLEARAGQDIRGGVYYVGRGRGRVLAGGEVGASAASGLAPILALGDAEVEVQAARDLTLETVLNPTVIQQPRAGYSDLSESPNGGYFFTYSPDSAVTLTTIAGDATLLNNSSQQGLGGRFAVDSEGRSMLTVYPANLTVQALGGDIRAANTEIQFPAARGTLTLLADGNIGLASDSASQEVVFALSDVSPGDLPSIARPATNLLTANVLLGQGSGTPLTDDRLHANPSLHRDDPEPVRWVAREGGIGSLESDERLLALRSPKPAEVQAGGDIVNLILEAQNLRPGDLTLVQAGGDIRYPTPRGETGGLSGNNGRLEVAGPGRFHLLAGGDVVLGTSQGIRTVGDRLNPALADRGADLAIWTGLGDEPDYAGFIAVYLEQSDVYQRQLLAYMGYDEDADAEQALAEFKALPRARQRALIQEIFHAELLASGTDSAEQGNGDFSRGFAAIEALFPEARDYDGDLTLFLSTVQTQDGGDIAVLAPGGLINVGLAVVSDDLTKQPDSLGILARREGNVDLFVHDDLEVNVSRVFAQSGGDVMVWASFGDIDAGSGAKTALAIPVAGARFDRFGNRVFDQLPPVAGSGIRAQGGDDGEAGAVALFAPGGVINAGDAGIGAGNLTVNALDVLGRDNIDISGNVVGVQLTQVPVSSLAGVSDLSASVAKISEEAIAGGGAGADQYQSMGEGVSLLFLDVKVLGYGEAGDGE